MEKSLVLSKMENKKGKQFFAVLLDDIIISKLYDTFEDAKEFFDEYIKNTDCKVVRYKSR